MDNQAMFAFTQDDLNKFVDLLITGEYKNDKLAARLAKVEPILFMDLAKGDSASDRHIETIDPDHITIFTNIVAGNQVGAIKLIREHFKNCGLKEAKDVADNLRLFMRNQHIVTDDNVYGIQINGIMSYTDTHKYYQKLLDSCRSYYGV